MGIVRFLSCCGESLNCSGIATALGRINKVLYEEKKK